MEPLYAAMYEIESNSYLTFIPRLEGERNYVRITFHDNSDGLAQSDYIGMKGGEQKVDISRNVWKSGIIVHELCHAIGMYHEMCRADRDEYVNIDFSGMSDRERHQYKKYSELGHNGSDFAEFDFNSIMMYSSWLGYKIVMTAKDGSTFWPQQEKLMNSDITTLAGIQPAINYTFYNPYGYNEPVFEKYRCVASKYLKCPESTQIRFKFQHKFSPGSAWGGYTVDDFDIKVNVSIVSNKPSGSSGNKFLIALSRVIPITETTSYEDFYLPIVNIPQGFYTAQVVLSGSVKGVATSDKLLVLERLMYKVSVYLNLDQVVINGRKIPIPSAFGNPPELRNQTFLQI